MAPSGKGKITGSAEKRIKNKKHLSPNEFVQLLVQEVKEIARKANGGVEVDFIQLGNDAAAKVQRKIIRKKKIEVSTKTSSSLLLSDLSLEIELRHNHGKLLDDETIKSEMQAILVQTEADEAVASRLSGDDKYVVETFRNFHHNKLVWKEQQEDPSAELGWNDCVEYDKDGSLWSPGEKLGRNMANLRPYLEKYPHSAYLMGFMGKHQHTLLPATELK